MNQELHSITPEQNPVTSPLLRAYEAERSGGEPFDLVEAYAEQLDPQVLNLYLNDNLSVGQYGIPGSYYRGRGDWRQNLFISMFQELWEADPEDTRRKYFPFGVDDVEHALQDQDTVTELYTRTDHSLAERGEKVDLMKRVYGGYEVEAEFDTIEEALEGAKLKLAKENMEADLASSIKKTEDPQFAKWLIDKLISVANDQDGFRRMAGEFRMLSVASSLQRLILSLVTKKVETNPELMDDYVAITSDAVKKTGEGKWLRPGSVRIAFYNSIFAEAGNYGQLQDAVNNDDIEVLQEKLTPSALFRYKLARKDFPEIFTREYYLARIKSCATVPVKPENIQEFNDFEEMLMVVPRKQAGEFIANSIDLGRSVLRELSAQGSNSAGSLEALLKKVAEQSGAVSAQVVVQLANKLSPQIKTEVHEDLRQLDPISVEDFPYALARIVNFARADTPVNEETEAVLDQATECAIMMAEIGTTNKLAQKMLTIGDLSVRYPKLTATGLNDLIDRLEQTKRESNVHRLYRDLKAQNKNYTYFSKWATGKGLLS